MLTPIEQKRLKNLGYSSSLNKLTHNQKKQVLREVERRPGSKDRVQRILKYMNKTGQSYGQARTAVFNNIYDGNFIANNALNYFNNGKNKYEKIAAQLLLEIQTLQTELHNKRNIINNLTKYRNGLRKATTTYKSTVRQFNNQVKKINPGKFVGTPRVQNMNKTLKKLENEKLEQEKRRKRREEALQGQTVQRHLKNFVKNSGVTVKQSTSKTRKKVEVN
jgi:hypothetical protein